MYSPSRKFARCRVKGYEVGIDLIVDIPRYSPMHRFLHTFVTPLIVLAASNAAKGLNVPNSPLLRTDAGLTYRVWLPADFAQRRGDVPLIIFSHGFGGCAQQSHTLTKSLADAGYAVFAPNHHDEGCDRYQGNMAAAFGAGGLHPEQPFTQPEKWDQTTEKSRRADIEAMINLALDQEPYRTAIDPSRIAVMGHSLGGYTGLAMAGAWSTWKDERIKCVLALSPYAAPFMAANTMNKFTVPVMFQTGSNDFVIGPTLLNPGGGYEKVTAKKYMVVLNGAGHFAWTELNPTYQKTIAAYAVAFFNRELRGLPAPLLNKEANGQVKKYMQADAHSFS
jgi:predicted dienelactone hydrolase